MAVVTRGVHYATAPDATWNEPVLDVYSRKGAASRPVVVMFEGQPEMDGGTSSFAAVAEAIVRAGGVAMVAHWGVKGAPSPPVEGFVRTARTQRDEGGCAVSYAVAHAKEYGGDPSRIAVLGHCTGANEASMVALGATARFSGCRAAATGPAVAGLVLWEGDANLIDPSWDLFGADLPTAIAAFAPWRVLDRAPKLPVRLMVAASSRSTLSRCGLGEEWFRWRDPTGVFRRMLDATGAARDDCIDMGEQSQLLADAMTEKGFDARVVSLTNPWTDHSRPVGSDLALLADEVVAVAGS